MRIIVVGDIHGRDIWQKIVAKEEYDLFIFIGDYFDSKEDIDSRKQIDNFLDIINFKQASPDKVILLTGNHDFHYIQGINQCYSGFQECVKTDISELINQAIKDRYLQMAHMIDDKFLFSHAGVTKTWAENNLGGSYKIDELINEMFYYKPNKFKFMVGKNGDVYGNDVTQSPIWVRPYSLNKDKFSNRHIQIVGHTMQSNIIIERGKGVILIDTLGTSKEYLSITDGVVKIEKINE